MTWEVPPAPSKDILRRIVQGYALSTAELAKLRRDRNTALDLEYKDAGFSRAARKWRAEHMEKQRVNEVQRAMAEKSKLSSVAQEKRMQHMGRQRVEREEREIKMHNNRDAVLKQQDRSRRETLDRIAQSERRAMVRDTVRAALVAQSRDDLRHDRVMFNDPAQLNVWSPSPGAYDVQPEPTRAPCFATHTVPKSRKKAARPAPGPGSYDIPNPKGIEYTLRGARTSSALPVYGEESPGPAAYNYQPPPRKGGAISSARVKTDVEEQIARAKQLPGPSDYYPPLQGANVSKSIGGRVMQESDRALLAAKHSPGPGSYSLPGKSIRGGVMAAAPRKPFLSGHDNPGPGDYHPTRTHAQERELKELSKEVLRLVKNRVAAPEEGLPSCSAKTFLTGRRGHPYSGSAPVKRRGPGRGAPRGARTATTGAL